jgi:hypothetical protein
MPHAFKGPNAQARSRRLGKLLRFAYLAKWSHAREAKKGSSCG